MRKTRNDWVSSIASKSNANSAREVRSQRLKVPRILTQTKSQKLMTAIAAALAGVSSAQFARADATWTGSTSQDWNNTANWSINPGGQVLDINTATGNYPIISATSSFTPIDISIGGGSGVFGRLDQTAGLASTGTNNWFFVGHSSGTGLYNLADTTTVGAGISGFGEGSGSLTVGKFWVGGASYSDNGVGTVNINTTGTLLTNSNDNGIGGNFIVGNAYGGGTASGTVNLENGTIQDTMEFWVGRSGSGVFNQTGGVVNSSGYFVLGREAPTAGGYSAGNGIYNLYGGTVNAATGYGVTSLASSEGASGTLNISGGVFNSSSGLLVAEAYFTDGGAQATGVVNVSGTGLLNLGTSGLTFAVQNSSVGNVNLNGGTIQAGFISQGTGTSGTFNFNGGTILLPALSRARRQAQQVQCASNLHNIGLSLLIYSGNNRGKLPQFLGNNNAPAMGMGSWFWDVEVGFRNAMLQNGSTRLTLYCPRNIDAMNTQALWDYMITPPTPLTGPLPDATGYGVLGYFFLISRPDTSYPDSEINASGSMPQQYKWNYQSTIIPHNTAWPNSVVAAPQMRQNIASQTEIVMDATLSEGSNRATATFGNIVGGYPTAHQSAHWYGGQPVGGNILFLDGHGEWRPFKQMQPRAVPLGTSNPFFWW